MADLIERYKITANLPSVLMNYCNRFNSKQLESITEMIYELENSIESADVQPIPQWISVDERLPKPSEKVLCYCISTSGDLDFYMIGCINKHWGLLKGETFVSEKETHRIVAYWRPLPPRPTIDYCHFCCMED